MRVLSSLAHCGFLLAMLASIQGTSLAEGTVVRHRGTSAVPIERKPPEYPRKASVKVVEGWVLASYVVGTDGRTSHIEIIDASIENFFEDSARKAIRDWTFKPATLDGQPIQQAKTKTRLVYLLYGSDSGVSRDFRKLTRRAINAIDEKDLEKASNLIERLEERQKFLAEVGYLDMLKGLYWHEKGDEHQARLYYERAMTIADDFPDTDMYRTLLRQSFFLNVRQNYLHDAIEHYNTLVELDGELPPEDPVRKLGEQLQSFLDGNSPFATTGEIYKSCETCQSDKPRWRHNLYRNRFSIDQVNGTLSEFKLLCGFQYVTIAFQPDMIWDVKDEWGNCVVHVYGEIGTKFRLVEYQETDER